MEDISRQQALDLLRAHFGDSPVELGEMGSQHYVYTNPQGKVLGIAGSRRLALEAAGIEVPLSDDEREFVGIGKRVMRSHEFVANARSATMARRIANALNIYAPGKRGA